MTEKLILFVIIITFVILFIGLKKSSNFTAQSLNIRNNFIKAHRLKVKGTDLYITAPYKLVDPINQIYKRESLTLQPILNNEFKDGQSWTYDGNYISSGIRNKKFTSYPADRYYLKSPSWDSNKLSVSWEGGNDDFAKWATDGRFLYNIGTQKKYGRKYKLGVKNGSIGLYPEDDATPLEIIAEPALPASFLRFLMN